MINILENLLKKYPLRNLKDGENAFKEIIQLITLLGLQRGKFFEHGAFYGGTALRLIYGLNRFSEDLDFTLFKSEKIFSLEKYFSAISTELNAYGLEVEISKINKVKPNKIDSAFVKSNTKIHFLKISMLEKYTSNILKNAVMKIKFEVDTEPASDFQYETHYLLDPISFPVVTLKKPDLFAGKVHALLFRNWNQRVKGRDFYDFLWFIKEETPLRINYLNAKSIQSFENNPDKKNIPLKNKTDLLKALNKKFDSLDFDQVKLDIYPFINNPQEIEFWNKELFIQSSKKIQLI